MVSVPDHSSARPLGVSILIWFNVLIASAQLLVGILLIVDQTIIVELGNRIQKSPPSASSLFFGGILHMVLVYGLASARKWSRPAQNIVAIPYLLVFPFGTLYAVLAWYFLNKKKSTEYFSPNPT